MRKKYEQIKIPMILITVLVIFIFVQRVEIQSHEKNYSSSFIEQKFNYSWVEKNKLIAHAMGEFEGMTYTNTKEAFIENYNKGHRVFEVDLNLTSDERLVAIHGHTVKEQMMNKPSMPKWFATGLPMTYEDLNEYLIADKYRTITYEQIVYLLEEYKDAYIITDTKEKSFESIEKVFSQIVEVCKKVDESILERMIIQVYDQKMYEQVMSIYNFKSIIYTLYQSPDSEQEVIDFVTEEGIKVVTMPTRQVSKNFIQTLKSKGVYTYVHTINNINEFDELEKIGVHGIYTDTIIPDQIQILDNNLKYLERYLSYLENDNYIVFGVIKNTDNQKVNETLIKIFNEYAHRNSESEYFVIDHTGLIREGDFKESNMVEDNIHSLPTEITRKDNGDVGIKIWGREYAINKEGVNLVVYSKLHKRIIDSVVIDIFDSKGRYYR